MGLGVHTQEKSSLGPRSESTHNSRNTPRSFGPPPPAPKKQYPGMGGRGVENRKNSLGYHFLSQNDDFTMG